MISLHTVLGMAEPTTSATRYDGGDASLAGPSLRSTLPTRARIPEPPPAPVLANTEGDDPWWLVPLDAAEELADVRAVPVKPRGRHPHCPPAGRMLAGRLWLPGGYRHGAEAPE